MVKTLIIYDETGYILNSEQGTPAPREPIGVPYLLVDIPAGKQLKIMDGIGVDVSVSPHQVILEDAPKSEIVLLKEQLQATQEAVDFLLLNGGV